MTDTPLLLSVRWLAPYGAFCWIFCSAFYGTSAQSDLLPPSRQERIRTAAPSVFSGDKPASIEGVLTLKGVSKPVTLAVSSFQAMPHPMLKKPALGDNASTTIKRSEFNAGKYAPYVGDEVRIDIAIEAIAP